MFRRFIGIVLALILAGFGTVVLVGYVRTAEARALAGEETVQVLVLREDVAAGTASADLKGLVETEYVPAKVRPADSVDRLGDLSGKVAAVDLVAGEQLLSGRFIDPELVGAVQVPEGLLQVTLAFDPQRALGGRLSAGDQVAVIASFTGGAEDEEGQVSGDTTHLILHKVLVTGVQYQGTTAPPPGGPDEDREAGDRAPSGELLITLAVDAPSAERLVFSAEHGTVWLGSEPEQAPESSTSVQTRETIYR